MSMKRSKQRSSGARRDDSGPAFSVRKGPPAPEKSWEEYVEGQPEEAFRPYSLQETFTAGVLINHAVFGKGAVVAVEGSRIEVLFAGGKKKLGHRQ